MYTIHQQALKTNMALTFLSTVTAVLIAVPVAIYVTANFIQPQHRVSAEQSARLDQVLAAANKPAVIKTASTTACQEPARANASGGVVLNAHTVPATTATTHPTASVNPGSHTTNHYSNTYHQTENNYHEDHTTNHYKVHNDITNKNTINTTIHDIVESTVNITGTITNKNPLADPTTAVDAPVTPKPKPATIDVAKPVAPKPVKPKLPKKPAVKKPAVVKPKTPKPTLVSPAN